MSEMVYEFHEEGDYPGNLPRKAGANLATLIGLGIPVRPGFVITSTPSSRYSQTDNTPPVFAEQLRRQLTTLERRTGRKFGRSDMPMLLEVQPETEFPVPIVIAPITNIGLNDESITGFATWTRYERLAFAAYCELMANFGIAVFGIEKVFFDRALHAVQPRGTFERLSVQDCRGLLRAFKDVVAEMSGQPFPQDPYEQLTLAVRAVFGASDSTLTRAYRLSGNLPANTTAAVSVRMMVFGDIGMDSGIGIASTRDPRTGSPTVSGTYLPNARGEDLVVGARTTMPMHELEQRHPAPYRELISVRRTLEEHFLDLCDIEFVIEKGRLWILGARVGRRTAASAFQVAAALHDEGLIDADETIRRVTGGQLSQLMFTRSAANTGGRLVATGVAASPGVAVGHAVFDSATAVRWADEGRPVILVRQETGPADIDGMVHAAGVLTGRGGRTSHAAVVARGIGRTCVCGAMQLFVDTEARQFTTHDGVVVGEGDLISIDGTSGQVYLGTVEIVPSPVIEYFEGRLNPTDRNADPLVRAVHMVMSHADSRRRLRVLANADTPEDAARARRFGAEGIGLCRTEHMFLGHRRWLIERLIVSDSRDHEGQIDTLNTLLILQRDDFVKIFTAMDGLPVAVRLLDAPLHEFLPDLTQLEVRVAVAEATGVARDDDRRALRALRRAHELNPMLGLRGVRLGLMVPGLYETQVRAIGEAVAQCMAGDRQPSVQIVLPLIGDARELEVARQSAETVLNGIAADTGVSMPKVFGAMIELPRAALTAGAIAQHADLFCFGTNDLTQTTWGMSRDDAETTFVADYLTKGILARSPFETCDYAGVGRLIDFAARDGRHVKPDLVLGVCGEHAGDPDSIHLFHRLGMDYVSSAPFQIPIARLEAGRAAIEGTG